MQNTANLLSTPEIIVNKKFSISDLCLHVSRLFKNIPKQTKDTHSNTDHDYILKRHGYSISIVKSLKQQIKTNTFLKHMYSSRGYNTESTATTIDDPNQITFIASSEEKIIGTLSIRTDSQYGLLADELYQSEINIFRKEDRKVCELSKLAVNSEINAQEIIASMFQCAYVYAKMHNAKDFFCEVNPRHSIPQKRMFGFKQIGGLRTCPRVNAPAVLLHLTTDYVATQTSELNNSKTTRKKPLYTHFMDKQKELQLRKRIQKDMFNLNNNNSTATTNWRLPVLQQCKLQEA